MKPERQVEELFHAALEREPSERDAFLEEACAGDGARLDDGHLRAAMLTRVLGVALGLALLVLGVVPAGETSPRDFSTAVIVLPRDRAAPRGGPATDQFRRPESVERELAERDAPFAALRRVDALFVPGGDPGGLHPDVLFPWLGRVAEVLQKHHPEARLRVSDQIMKTDPSWYEAYYAQVNRRPAWLGGVVFGPWGATPLPKMREIVDPVLPIRRYPDISHTVIGQYPVPDWDLAFAMTLGREPIIPRPVFFKHVHNLLDEHAVGGITYSEGVSEDVNKFVWTDQDWDPDTRVAETLRDYARLLVGVSLTDTLRRWAPEALLDRLRRRQGPASGGAHADPRRTPSSLSGPSAASIGARRTVRNDRSSSVLLVSSPCSCPRR